MLTVSQRCESACEDRYADKVSSNSSELAMVLNWGEIFLLGMNLPPLSSIPEKLKGVVYYGYGLELFE